MDEEKKQMARMELADGYIRGAVINETDGTVEVQDRRHGWAREDEVRSATEEHLDLDGGAHRLHVFQDIDDVWVVWLNTEASDFDGLILGMGGTRDEAVAQAVAVMESAERLLQGRSRD